MTALLELLKERIARDGPMTVAEYMTECLLNPEHGYYSTRDPFGTQGDFITAPEISQMFGELIGLCLAQAWIDRDRPDRFLLVEPGAGRGTLMADILRAGARVPGFVEAAEVHLIEASPVLRKCQTETIPGPIQHHDQFGQIPDGPLFLVANEFFDALPVRQFVRDGAGWRERVVGLDADTLAFGLTDRMAPDFLQSRLDDTRDGQLVEVSLSARSVAAWVGNRIANEGGIALVIDYGEWRSLGDTLQAVRAHEKADLLTAPGTTDLTAHVDFEALADAASPAETTRMTTQGMLLERLGITTRANALAAAAGESRRADIAAAHRRLTHPDEMGTLFKAMALYKPTDPPPTGFAP